MARRFASVHFPYCKPHPRSPWQYETKQFTIGRLENYYQTDYVATDDEIHNGHSDASSIESCTFNLAFLLRLAVKMDEVEFDYHAAQTLENKTSIKPLKIFNWQIRCQEKDFTILCR